jgi:hypothetical protein
MSECEHEYCDVTCKADKCFKAVCLKCNKRFFSTVKTSGNEWHRVDNSTWYEVEEWN